MTPAQERLARVQRIDRLIAPILFLVLLLVNKYLVLQLTFEQVGSIMGLYALNSLAIQNTRIRS